MSYLKRKNKNFLRKFYISNLDENEKIKLLLSYISKNEIVEKKTNPILFLKLKELMLFKKQFKKKK